VRYLNVAQPDDLPEGFGAIARERTSGAAAPNRPYKLRGPGPFPTKGPLHKWRCPLKGHADSKEEVDIAWTGDDEPSALFAQLHRTKGDAAKAMPKELRATPLGSQRRDASRRRAAGIKVERWDLQGGEAS